MPGDADQPYDPAILALDADRVDRLAAGDPPPLGDAAADRLAAWRDEVRRPVSGWVEDPSAPSGWRYERDLSPSGSVTQMLPTIGRLEYEGHVDYAQVDGEYVYTDPTQDDAWPRITEHDADELPDAFPPGWSGEPTERDQAAIDAGNA